LYDFYNNLIKLCQLQPFPKMLKLI
jgi:hypothetical protein